MSRGGMVVVVALAGARCDGGSMGGDGGPTADFATTPGASVLTPAVRKVTLTETAGGVGAPMPPSCVTGLWSYMLSLDTKRLALEGCGEISLTDPEVETLTAAAQAVTVSARQACGADAPARELRVASATDALTYGDDFYACLMNYDQYVEFDGLNDLETAFAGFYP